MICRADNATKATLAKGAKDYSMKEKLCLCDEENGYVENIVDKHCSGKQHLVTFRFTLFYLINDNSFLTFINHFTN